MDTKVNDADDTTAQKIIGARFRAAREAAGLSRAQVERASNVSQKAIEKFEGGVQSPNFVRFAALCAAVGKSVDAILNGREAAPAPLSRAPAAIDEDNDDAESYLDPLDDALAQLDDLREAGFRDGQRRGIALVGALREELKALEPADLLDLARKRGVDRTGCPSALELHNALADDIASGQEACAKVEERIIDTAVLGTDLFAAPIERLSSIADQLKRQFDLDEGFMGWGKHDKLVPQLREPLRQLAFAGKGQSRADKRASQARA